MDFAVPMDHRVKISENEKINKYLDLARGLKKLWNMKVTVIPIVVSIFGTVSKGLGNRGKLELRGRIETIQTSALLKPARMHRSVLEF